MAPKKKDSGYHSALRYAVRRWAENTEQYVGVVDLDVGPGRPGYVVEKFPVPAGATEQEQAALYRKAEALAGKRNAPLLWERAHRPATEES